MAENARFENLVAEAKKKITEISATEIKPAGSEEVIDLDGAYLAPGFIDLHIHGALGRDTMEASDDAFEAICQYHAKGGTTALALTTITATSEEISKVLGAVKSYRSKREFKGAQVLGVHVEGPYFSPEKRGAHRAALIRDPQPEEYGAWLQSGLVTHSVDADGAFNCFDSHEGDSGRRHFSLNN